MTPIKINIGFVNHRPVSDTIRNPFDLRRHWESKLEIEQQPELKEDQDKPSKKHIDQVRRPYSIFPDHRLSHLTPHKMYIEFKRNRPFLDTMANKYDWRGWWKKKPEIELQQELKADQDRPREDFRSKYQECLIMKHLTEKIARDATPVLVSIVPFQSAQKMIHQEEKIAVPSRALAMKKTRKNRLNK
jgi:hypothetical protein